MPVDWASAMQSQQHIWDQTNQRIADIAQQMRTAMQQRYIGEQIKALDGPDKQAALQRIYALNPQLGMQMEDQLYQRGERQRASDFREGEAGMLLGGPTNALARQPGQPQMGQPQNAMLAASPSPPQNAMLGSPTPPQIATASQHMPPPPMPGTSASGMPAQTLAAPSQSPPSQQQSPDPMHPALQALEPHRDNILKGAAIIRQINPTDDVTWNNARSAAGRAGVDLTDVPKGFDPEYVKNLLAVADHLSGSPPQAASAPAANAAAPQPYSAPQPAASSGYSPDYERAVRADPEKFLTFQGKRIEVTKGQLAVAKAVNEGAMQILGGVHDQASYDNAKAQARALYEGYGQDFSAVEQTLPPEYSPETIRDLQMRGMGTAQQLQQIVRENRLDADISNMTADNQRADQSAASLRGYRAQRLKQIDRAEAGRDARHNSPPARAGGPSKAPTPSSVIGAIMAKQASGTPLSPAEQETMTEFRAGKGRKGTRAAPSEPVALGPHGERLVVRGGKWVPDK